MDISTELKRIVCRGKNFEGVLTTKAVNGEQIFSIMEEFLLGAKATGRIKDYNIDWLEPSPIAREEVGFLVVSYIPSLDDEEVESGAGDFPWKIQTFSCELRWA